MHPATIFAARQGLTCRGFTVCKVIAVVRTLGSSQVPGHITRSPQTSRSATWTAVAQPCIGGVRRMGCSAACSAEAAPGAGWQSLNAPASELRLEFTLPTGQSFRWRQTGPQEYTGVVQQRVVRVRQEEEDVWFRVLARGAGAHPEQDAAVLRDYFNLGISLADLMPAWAQADPRFRSITPYFPGVRVLRQDPVECLFQFVCSSNNHISRIHGMVERLCREYGTPLPVAAGDCDAAELEDLAFYAFPTIEQLQEATDDALRSQGFGYRAKFIVGSVALLAAKEGGGAAWLRGLRSAPYGEASEALCALPGVGPKVAACVCLFSLDKHGAIPVDTHVWQLAARYYTPQLRGVGTVSGKSLTKALMVAVEEALQQRFGAHAGWAHTTLFISELASQRDRLPAHLQPGSRARAPAAAAAELVVAVKEDAVAEACAVAAAKESAGAGPALPAAAGRRGRKRAASTASAEAVLCEAESLPPVRHNKLESTARTASVLLEEDAAAVSQAACGPAAAAVPPAENGASRCLASRADSVDDSAPGKTPGNKGSRRLKDWRRRKAGVFAAGPAGLHPSPCSSAVA